MFVKLFILGRPGCGKSKTAQHIAGFVKLRGWSTYRFKDYDILENMFQEDVLKERFRPSEYKGFDVRDTFVFDEALLVLERNIYQHMTNTGKNEFITIEFARADYDQAFTQFSQAFLRDAHFLFIDADFDKCKQRIYERITRPITADDHFISDYALDTYYSNQHPPQDENIKSRLTVIENQGLWDDTMKEINSTVQHILKKH